MELNWSKDKFGKYKSILSVIAMDQCGHTTGVPSLSKQILIRRYSPERDVAVTNDDGAVDDTKSVVEVTVLLMMFDERFAIVLDDPFVPLPIVELMLDGDKKFLGDNPPAAFNFKFCLFLTKLVDDFQYVSNFEVSNNVPENGNIT